MLEESGSNKSKFQASRMVSKNKNVSKLSMFETNMENYSKNQKFTLEKIDPKGVSAVGVYAAFSGVIESARLFSNCDETLQISYLVSISPQWHDETPETDDTEGESHFCQSRNGVVTFSLGFDFLISCMYVSNWPKIIFKVKGFNRLGELITRGYAHVNLPSTTGQFVQKAYIYSIIRNERWYHRWIPFLEPEISVLDQNQIERVIVKGQGRQIEKVKSIGIINVRVEVMLRNFSRFGYR